jgi:hypothetical protein
MRTYRVTIGWGCLALGCGTALVAGWVILAGLVAAATVVAEIGAAAGAH